MARLFSDMLTKAVPPWLSNRWESGLQVGFKYLWTMIAPLDAMIQVALEGGHAAWPGYGTPTALPLTGRMRLVTRGMSESDASYASRQRAWRTQARIYGSQEAIAREIHEYCAGQPKVRVVNRAGFSTVIAADGTLTRGTIAWDWDSKSNPEKAGHWSEEWIIIYAPPWAISGPHWTGQAPSWGAISTGIGQLCPRQDVDTIKALIDKAKGRHSRVNAVIWTYDPALFDPTTPASMPDGWWGRWSRPDPADITHRIRSRSTSTRVWEPHRADLAAENV